MELLEIPKSLMSAISKRLVEEGIMTEDGKKVDKSKKKEKITIDPEINTNNSSVTHGVHASDQTGQGASGGSMHGTSNS